MSQIPIPITAIFTSILALMLVGISIRITMLRARTGINFFDGGNPVLGRALRVQGNFIEYVPMTLALLGLVEWLGGPAWLVYASGAVLVVARIVHAWGLYAGVMAGRVIGTSANWALLALGGLLVLGRVA